MGQPPGRPSAILAAVVALVGLGVGVGWAPAAGAQDHCDATVSHGDSIQAAVDEADPGDAICVEPGVYRESVTLDVGDLTLQGTPAGTATLVAADGAAVTVPPEGSGATVQGLHVQGSGPGQPLGTGIHVLKGTAAVTVADNAIRGLERGIFVQRADVQVTGNTFDATTRAVQHNGQEDDTVLEGNRFLDNGIGLFAQNTGEPFDITLTDNAFTTATAVAVANADGARDQVYHLDENHWGLVGCALIEQTRILDRGQDNTFHLNNYYADPAGQVLVPIYIDVTCA